MFIYNFIQENQVLLRLMGINVLVAYSMYFPLSMGQFQVAQPVFIAFAGYTGALLTQRQDLPFGIVVVIAIAAALVAAGLLAPALMRLSGIYLGLVSFALVGLTSVVALNLGFLGGSNGLYAIPRLVGNKQIWICVAVVVIVCIAVQRSRFGQAMSVVNDDPIAAGGAGLNVFRMHIYVFMFSALIAGLAGVLRVHTFHQINASDFGLAQILGILTFVIVGGLRSVWGPLVGVVTVMLIRTQIEALADWELAVNGVLLLAIIIFLPDGLTSMRPPAVVRTRVNHLLRSTFAPTTLQGERVAK
jgi:branched-chain amino acid transport system permease protein